MRTFCCCEMGESLLPMQSEALDALRTAGFRGESRMRGRWNRSMRW